MSPPPAPRGGCPPPPATGRMERIPTRTRGITGTVLACFFLLLAPMPWPHAADAGETTPSATGPGKQARAATADIASVDFMPAANGSLPTWLLSPPLPAPLPALEHPTLPARPPVEGERVGRGVWRYCNAATRQVVIIPGPAPKNSWVYAYSQLLLRRTMDTVVMLNAVTPAACWVDHARKLVTRPERESNLHRASTRLRLQAGPHSLLVRVRLAPGGAGFVCFALAPDKDGNEFRALPGGVIRLRLRGWSEKRSLAEAARCLKFSSQPRFVNAGEPIRFKLRLHGGLPLGTAGAASAAASDAGGVRLRLSAQEPAAGSSFKGASRAKSLFETRLHGISAQLRPPRRVSWMRLLVRGELVCGGRVIGQALTPIFCEANLKAGAAALDRHCETVTNRYSTAAALIRLSREQCRLLRRDRVNRTLRYGERFFSIIDRALRAAACFAAGRDPLAGLQGAQEGAYISRADDSVQPYRFYVPRAATPGRTPATGVPLLVILHGYVPYYNKLDWTSIDTRLGTAMEKLGWLLLLPFGRSNTDFLSIGEQDVLRAIGEIRKRYPVDRSRVYLAGYSMGGSGVWTMLSHYPDRFGAAQAWSGRTDYYYWHADDYARAGVSKRTIPAWKRWLIDTDNPYGLAFTLLDTPVRGIHPADDTLVKPGQTQRMYELLKPPGGRMRYVVPPAGDGHWYFSRELADPTAYRWMLAHAATPPLRVRHICCTPKYGRKFWLRVSAVREWGRPARVQAHLEPERRAGVVTLAENVLALSLVTERGPVKLDGFRLRLSAKLADKQPSVWDPAARTLWLASRKPDPARPMKATLGASPGLYGPVKEAFNGPFLLVTGTTSDARTTAGLAAKAARFQDEWWDFSQGRPRLVRDRDLTPNQVRTRNLVLFGSPASNSYLHRIMAKLPFSFPAGGYGVGSRVVRGEHLGLVAIYPNPENPRRYVVVMDGLYYGDNLPGNHKWDLVPDFIVFGRKTDAYDGTNTARLAGLFDTWWQPSVPGKP